MHWLYFNNESPAVLDRAGFAYDSTCGFNDTVGYRAGTGQVFKPIGVKNLLELPMHIQDTALFYPGRMHLTESEAWKLCLEALENSRRNGGVLTILWHDRSLAPERLWGDFYEKLLARLEDSDTWFATASQVVSWFRMRRAIRFQTVRKDGNQIEIQLESVPPGQSPDFAIRASWMGPDQKIHHSEVPLAGRKELTLEVEMSEARQSGNDLALRKAHSDEKIGPMTAFGA
jgi:hypothetical protein